MFFSQVFYMHISFSIQILLKNFSPIVSKILKISRIRVLVSYRIYTRAAYPGLHRYVILLNMVAVFHSI